jgi:hypothetical protein
MSNFSRLQSYIDRLLLIHHSYPELITSNQTPLPINAIPSTSKI